MHKGQQRLLYLDGLRGVAILLVAGWHYLGPVYAMHMGHGLAWAWLPGIRHGWAGVNLFFLISGFVIFLTLERCCGVIDFLGRRWLRLFPGMAVASAIIFAGSHCLPATMPGGPAEPADLLPGLLFVPPVFLRRWLGLPLRSLDGAFWSLHVEMAFYVVIGPLYFGLGWRRAVAVLIALWAVMLALPFLAVHLALPGLRPTGRWLYAAGFGYFGWFASGALFLKARLHRDRGLLATATAIGMVAALTTVMPHGLERSARVALFLCPPAFAAVLYWAPAQRALEWAPAQVLGFVSYPFYLVHSALGVGLIGALEPAIGPVAVPLTLVLTLALAWAIARFAEPPLAAALRPWTDRLRFRLGRAPSSVVVPAPGAPA